jgi:hypothetical protein
MSQVFNLTGRERHKLNSGYKFGSKINVWGNDTALIASLTERGLVEKDPDGPYVLLTDLGRIAMDFIASKREEEREVWAVALATVKEIESTHEAYAGTSRDGATYTHHEDGTIDVRTVYKAGNQDGSDSVFTVTATRHPKAVHKGEPVITVTIDETVTHADDFWGPGGPRDEDDPACRVVVNNVHYIIVPDTNSRFQGHGGAVFEIAFHDGRRVTSRNLWTQGKIPPKWRDRFPNNAEFIQRDRPSLADQLGLKAI